MRFVRLRPALVSLLLGLSLTAGRLPAASHPDLTGDRTCQECHRNVSGHVAGPGFDKGAHDQLDCGQCHDLHGTTSNLHLIRSIIATPNSGDRAVVFTATSGPNSFADGDAVYDGICEVCHTQTAYHRGDPGGNHAHNAATDCTQCHGHEDGFAPVGGDCLSCHNRPQPAGVGYRRQIVENSGDGGGDFVLTSHHVDDGSGSQVVTASDCTVCHDQSQHQGFGDGVSVLLNDPAGGASILYDGTPASLEPFCLGCHDGTHTSPFSDGVPAPDLSAWDGHLHGPGDLTCLDCHTSGHGSDNLKLVGTTITAPDNTSHTVVFTALSGPNSFADGDAVYDGICEVCHTQTAYHRGDPGGNHAHNAATDCTQCHGHEDGFAPVGGDCLSCHNRPQPAGVGYRRQIVENSGDGGGDFVLTSHHVDDGSGSQVVTASDCTVCHDQSQHQGFGDGVSVLLNDPAGGASVLYNGTTPTLQPFCTGCHLAAPGQPFSDGRSTPVPVGDWASSTHDGHGIVCADCHQNGHGSDWPHLLADRFDDNDNNQYNEADYALCWNCHDANQIVYQNNAFADLHKKHVEGERAPCLICHSPHGPTDAGEPMVTFQYGIDRGMDIQFINGYDVSTSFWISGNRGYCYIKCHGKDHKPKDYDRSQASIPLDRDTGRLATTSDFIRSVMVSPSPSRGPVTVRIETQPGKRSDTAQAAIYDLAGRLVRRLEVSLPSTGQVEVHWDGRDRDGRRVDTGVYLCRIAFPGGAHTAKLVILH